MKTECFKTVSDYEYRLFELMDDQSIRIINTYHEREGYCITYAPR